VYLFENMYIMRSKVVKGEFKRPPPFLVSTLADFLPYVDGIDD